jgi:hypothetical protein
MVWFNNILKNNFNKMNWQIIANISTSFALIIALVVFIWEIHATRKEKVFNIFIKFMDTYDNIVN